MLEVIHGHDGEIPGFIHDVRRPILFPIDALEWRFHGAFELPSPMFNFFKRKAEVLNHWIAFVDGFQTSPSEFYDALAKELTTRQVPQMELSRIEFPEGGLLSEKRLYLRLLREGLVFDVCAAPFGSGFFFSCRTAEIPVALQWWHLLVFLLGGWFLTGGLFVLFLRWTGSFWLAVFALLLLYGLLLYTLRNAVALGLQNLDATLIKLPVIGPLYEVFLRRETYHRADSRLCYLEVVPNVVKTLVDEVTAAKGVKRVRQYELAPVLGELYRPVTSSTRPPVAPPAGPPLP